MCCNTDQIGTSVATKAKDFVSCSNNRARSVHGIAISIRHVAFFEICNDDILHSPPIPLVTNASAPCCPPGLRLLAYIFTSNCWKGFPGKPREYWGVAIPTDVFHMILKVSTPWDLVSMAQASFLVEKWYYSSIPQIHGLKLQSFPLSISCCDTRNTSGAAGIYYSVCYTWSHMECTDLSSTVPSESDKYICSGCRENRPCTVLETGGVHQAYREKRARKSCSVVHDGSATDLLLRVSKPSSRRPELRLIRNLGPPPPRNIDYTIFFSGIFSGLAYGFD